MHENHEFPYETAFIRKLRFLSNYATNTLVTIQIKPRMMKMEKLQGVYIGHNTIILLLCLFIFIGCKKTNDHPMECGCLGDFEGYITYDSYYGQQYTAELWPIGSLQDTWYMSIHIPDANYGFFCKVFNPNSKAIRKLADTGTIVSPIPVKVAGMIYDLCEGEHWPLLLYPGTREAYISVGSIIAQ